MRYAYCVITWSGGFRLVETLRSVPEDAERLLVIDSSQHKWQLSKAWNYGVDRLCYDEKYDAVIMCNDDIVLQPDTGQLLAEALLERQFTEDRPHKDRMLLAVSAYNLRDLPDQGARWGTGPDFSCFAVGRQMFETIGKFDENFKPAYFEDNDAHYRMRLAGFEALSFAPYYHHGSQTIRHDAERAVAIEATFDENARYYERKWGGGPGHEKFRTPFGR